MVQVYTGGVFVRTLMQLLSKKKHTNAVKSELLL